MGSFPVRMLNYLRLNDDQNDPKKEDKFTTEENEW